MPGFGPEYVMRARDIPQIAVFGGMIHDAGGGVVRRGPGREPLVTYKMAKRDRATVPRVIRLMADTFFAAGAKECFLPVLGLHAQTPDSLPTLDLEGLPGRRFECASQHPLGSCRMGATPQDGAVDDSGKVWDVDGLYIADGSVVPTSLGVNPQLTIMAMALRIARRMLERPLR
jgi:choline dehydrogenase-like flavoprotein